MHVVTNRSFSEQRTCSLPVLEDRRARRSFPRTMVVNDATMASTQQSLLATVYGQCWPSPSFFKQIKKSQGDRSVRDRTLTEQGLVTPCKQSVRWSADRDVTAVGGKSTDDGTGKVSGKWTPLSGLDSSRQEKRDAHLCRLTSSEFRRLSEQVKLVNVTNGRVKSTGLKKLYRPDMETSRYRRQFAACLQAFTDKRWLPYEHEREETLMRRRSRPASTGSTALRELVSSPISQLSAKGASTGRLATTATSGGQMKRLIHRGSDTPEVTSVQITRPVSCPATHSSATTAPAEGCNRNNNTCTNNRLHSFDSLTPIVLYKLSDGAQPQSVYGSRPVSVARVDDADYSDSDDTELAIDSEAAPCDNEAAPCDTTMAEDKGELGSDEIVDVASLTGGLSSSGSTSGESDSEDDPEDERAPEPTLEDVQLDKMPHLQLRPEKLDAFDVPSLPRGDRRKYDFDARVADPAPTYVYPDPLTFGQTTVNLMELEANDLNWRTSVKRPVDRETAGWLDRLQRIERLQRRTTVAEETKARCRSGGRSRRVQGGGTPSSRAPSVASGKLTCCADCLQAACVGDCPAKQALPAGACLLCREVGCDGHCAENIYNVHSRRDPRADDESSGGSGKKTKPRPLSSVSSIKQQPSPLRSTRGPVNVNTARSKSVGVTFTRGQQPTRSVSSQRSPATPPTGGVTLEKDLARLDITCTQRTHSQNAEWSPQSSSPLRLSIVGLRTTSTPVGSVQQSEELRNRAASARQRHRPKGRSSIIPGKSYFSQKRDSLSAPTQCDVVKCRLNRHARHARKKRGKTSS